MKKVLFILEVILAILSIGFGLLPNISFMQINLEGAENLLLMFFLPIVLIFDVAQIVFSIPSVILAILGIKSNIKYQKIVSIVLLSLVVLTLIFSVVVFVILFK